jgi:capsular polysaccharide biosynthesis protein
MPEKSEAIEIDLKRLFLVLINKAWIILLVGILCAGLLLSYTYFFVTPQYSANIKLYVNNTYGANSPGFSASQLQAAQSLADTYMVFLLSRTVLNEVAETTGLPYTNKELENMISSSAVEDTEVFQVKVVCENYLHAAEIANAIADILPARIAATVDGSSVRVVDYAVPSDARVSPSYTKTAILGALLGFAVAVAIILLRQFTDNTIHDKHDLQQCIDVPVLGEIPSFELANNSKKGGRNHA